MKNLKILLVMVFLHLSINLLSQEIRVKGTVVSEERIPIEFANVSLLDGESNIIAGTITDSLGRFELIVKDHVKTEKMVLAVSYIGYETLTQSLDREDFGIITLNSGSNALQEVVVSGRRSPYSMTGGTISADIQNSILKDAGSAMEILKQLPLVSTKNDIVSVFGKGDALIYINNREVRSVEELNRLSSRRIKKVDIITNPGAQYSASVGAVIRIYTASPDEGFSGNITTRVQKGKAWGESLIANTSYAKNKFTLFANYALQNTNTFQTQETEHVIYTGETASSIVTANDELNLKRTYHNLGLAGEYKISDEHLLGVKYDHSFLSCGHYNVVGETTAYLNLLKDAQYTQTSDYYPGGNGGNLNLFYSGKLSDWSIDFNADYVFGGTTTSAKYDNTETLNNIRNIINSNSENNYNLGAVRVDVSRDFEKSTIQLGTDYSKTLNESFYSNDSDYLQDDLPQTTTTNNQDMFALYVNYVYNPLNFNIVMGLRYEFINQLYYINGIKQEAQSKSYSNLFPTLSISRQLFNQKGNMSLAYRRTVQRPTYYHLRGDVQYNSPYSYEAGNPLLQNSYIDDISYNASYKNLYLMASYKLYRDKILFTVSQFEDQPITLSSFINVDGFKELSLSAVWDPTVFRIWNPELGIWYRKQFFELANGDEVTNYNNPYVYFSLNNVLRLARGFSFVIQAKYWAAHNSGLTYVDSGIYVDTYVQISTENKAMVLRIGAEDIFNTYRDNWEMIFGNVVFRKNAITDSKFVYIQLTFNIHNIKRYTGKGTRSSEMNRLNSL